MFEVRATDPPGNTDPTPAASTFAVRPKCSPVGPNLLGARICLFPVCAP